MSSYGLWLSAAGMKVSDHRQTVLANNIANSSTTGFKHDLAVVMQRRVESRASADGASAAHPVLDGMSGGVNVLPTQFSRQQGPIEATGRSLDVAVRGDGFFEVGDGESKRYTRNGEFAVNSAGEVILATESGQWRVHDDGGVPILVDPAGDAVRVSEGGMVRQGTTEVGRVGLFNGEEPDGLRKSGENLFESTTGRMVPATGAIVSASREGSTFDAVEGLASMIEVSRAYQMNATMLQLQDQLTGQAVTTLGRMA